MGEFFSSSNFLHTLFLNQNFLCTLDTEAIKILFVKYNNLLNTIIQLLILWSMLSLLFIQMCGVSWLFVIYLVQNDLLICSFIDNCTRVTWIFLRKDPFDVFQLFVNLYHDSNSIWQPIKKLHFDNGVQELTCADTLQPNQILEWKKCLLLDFARVLLF